MSDKRETPLRTPSLKEHHCTINLRLEKLEMVPFFRGLSEEQLREVNKKFTANHYSKGDTIYWQDDEATMLRVVVLGNIKLVSQTMVGNEVLLEMLQPGDYFGNPSVSGHDRYHETAQAQTDACILSIRLTEFRKIMDSYPSVALSVLDIMSNRLNEARQRIRHLTTLPVEKRIAHILVTLADKLGEKHSLGLLIQLPLSGKDLADMAGTSTATVSRIMSRFQDEGLITSGRQWVAIKNKSELFRISAEE